MAREQEEQKQQQRQSPYVRTRELRVLLGGVTRRVIFDMIRRGELPAPVRNGAHTFVYERAAIMPVVDRLRRERAALPRHRRGVRMVRAPAFVRDLLLEMAEQQQQQQTSPPPDPWES